MRSREEILNTAGTIKLDMLRRSSRINQLLSRVGEITSKIDQKTSLDRLETIKDEVDILAKIQDRDAHYYAVLRWVLGVTKEIDLGNLELQL